MKHHSPPRRFAAGIGAALAALLGLTLLAPAAMGSPADPPPVTSGSLPDALAATGSLTITKLSAPPAKTQDSGAQNTTGATISNSPISGVVFNVTKVDQYNNVDIDLTTQAGWDTAAAAAANWSVANATFDATTYGANTPTAADGTVSFTGLPLGLYYVEEVSTPAGVVASPPFLVTIPMTDPSGASWMYDIYVYPKNNKVTATKSVDDTQATVAGDPITYTITGTLPMDVDANSADQEVVAPLTAYQVDDTLDSRLTFVSAAVYLTDGTNSTPLVAGQDYTVTNSPANSVKVVLSDPSGLAKLTAAAQTNYSNTDSSGNYVTGYSPIQVEVVINATVNNTLNTNTAAGPQGTSNIIPNQATVFPDSNSISKNTGVQTHIVQSYWGGIDLHKVDSAGSAITFPATFQIFDSLANAQALTDPLAAQHVDDPTNQNVNFVTGSDGTGVGSVGILGLAYYPNYAGSDADLVSRNCTVPGTSAAGTTYWVVETVAPTGYELLADPVAVCITGSLDNSAGTQDDVNIINIAHNAGFEMPFTGWFVNNQMMVLGALILAAGGGAYAINRRKAAKA